jgi:hypothetical protein
MREIREATTMIMLIKERLLGKSGRDVATVKVALKGKEDTKMKRVATSFCAFMLSVACAGVVYAQAPAASTSTAVDPALIAQLEQRASQDIADGRNGNKNNPAFARKAYEVNQLVDRLKRGENVSPAEIDEAMEPAHVW